MLFFGDFFQLDPVLQTSLLLPRPEDYHRQKPEIVAKHVKAYKLFLQFTVVVTRNQFIGLKLVNGASFLAADIVPDLTINAIALASDVTLHLALPLGRSPPIR